jgi:glycosyltransferase involved in cell wall biosynthesis
MCRALNQAGIHADIASTDADVQGNLDMPLGTPFQMEGTTVYCFRCSMLRRYGFSSGLTWWIRRNLRNYDLVHFHAFFSYVTIPLAYYAEKYKVPYVIKLSGELDPWSLKQSRIKKWLFLSLFGRHCLNAANALHVTSESERTAARRVAPATPGVVIPLGTDTFPEEDLPPKGEFRKQYPMLDHKTLIVFLSRLDHKKGLDRLIPAISVLAKKRDNFAVVVAGSGDREYEARIRDLVRKQGLKEKIIFTGFLHEQAKLDLLRDADVFVLPSYDENFGIAVIEAMAVGAPVVISHNVGIHHQVTEYGAGLVTSCEPGDIAQALSTLLENESLRRKMGENGRRVVAEQFTWEKIATGLMELYQAILSRGKMFHDREVHEDTPQVHCG